VLLSPANDGAAVRWIIYPIIRLDLPRFASSNT
jgi:hypothetical protein